MSEGPMERADLAPKEAVLRVFTPVIGSLADTLFEKVPEEFSDYEEALKDATRLRSVIIENMLVALEDKADSREEGEA